jgi:hypothetical protein
MTTNKLATLFFQGIAEAMRGNEKSWIACHMSIILSTQGYHTGYPL